MPRQPLCRELAFHLIPKWTAASYLEVFSSQSFSSDGGVDGERVVVALKACTIRPTLLKPIMGFHMEPSFY